MIRWSYVAPRLAVLALLWGLFALALDPLLERGLEKGGSAALGARVELGALDTRFAPPGLSLRRFAAADPGEPMRNLLEFGSAEFELQGIALLERKVVIEKAELTGLAWGTPRSRSGALPAAPPSRAAAKLREWAASSRDVSFAALAGAKEEAQRRVAVKPEDLASLRLAKELEGRLPAAAADWRRKAEAFDAPGKAKELERLLQGARSGDPVSRLAKAAELRQKLQEAQAQADQVRADIRREAERARADLEAARKAKTADLDALRDRLKLPSLDPERLTAYLLGQETAARLTKVLRLVEAARRRMPAKSQAREQGTGLAGRGATIEFPRERSWPSFWLRRAVLAGTADLGGPLELTGSLSDFSSDPPLTGRPARVELSGGQGARKARLLALLDHTGELPRDELHFEYAGLPVAPMTAGDPSALGVSISSGTASLAGTLALSGDALSGSLTYRQAGVRLAPAAGAGGLAAKVAGSAFAGIRVLEARLSLGGTLQEPSFTLDSNLGAALAQGLKAAIGQEAQARLQEAQAQVARLVDGRLAGLDGQLERHLGSALEPLAGGKLRELEEKLRGQAASPLPRLFR